MILIPPQLTHFKIFKFRFPTLYLSFCEYISPSVFFLSFFFPLLFSIKQNSASVSGLVSTSSMDRFPTTKWRNHCFGFLKTSRLYLYYYIHENLCLHFFALFLWLPKIAMPELPVNPTRTATLQPLSTEPLNECVELNPIPIL